MKPINLYYIDEKVEEGELYKTLLELSNQISVRLEQPKSIIGESVPNNLAEIDIFLVDYQLTTKQQNGTTVSYKGGTLSTAIRESTNEYPIVLITKRDILSNADKQKLINQLHVIDDVVYKGELTEDDDRNRVIHLLISLATGFCELRAINKEERNWPNLLVILSATQEEGKLLQMASPPIYENQLWDVAIVSNWIRNVILSYPGILYNPVFAATELRISEESFLHPEVQGLFAAAKYTGIFAPYDGRWWRERLWNIAMDYVEDIKFTDKFASVFEKRTNIHLQPSKSVVRDEIPANAVCYILNKPVMYEYTVAYKPDNRPPIMDPARVSYKAIQSDCVKLALLEGVSDDYLNQIRAMNL